MVAGIQIFNDSNTIQIDETYKNLTFIQKGTTTLNAQGRGNVAFTNRQNPVLAVRSTSNANRACVIYVEASGSTYTFQFGGRPNATFDYYLFDNPPSDSLPSAGFVVYNASGEITFRFDRRCMKIIGTVAFDPSPGTEQITSFASGKTYATVGYGGQQALAFFIPGEPDPLGMMQYNISASYFDGGNFRIQPIDFGQAGPWPSGVPPSPEYTYTSLQYILDVTGY